MNAKVLLLVASAFVAIGLAISFSLAQVTGNPNFHVKVNASEYDIDLSVQDGVLNYVATTLDDDGIATSYSYSGANNRLFIGVDGVNFDCYDVGMLLEEMGSASLTDVQQLEDNVFVWPSPFTEGSEMRITVHGDPESITLEIDGEELETTYFSRTTSTVVNDKHVGDLCTVIAVDDDAAQVDENGRRFLKMRPRSLWGFIKKAVNWVNDKIVKPIVKVVTTVSCITGARSIDDVIRCFATRNNDDHQGWTSRLSDEHLAYAQMATCVYGRIKKGDDLTWENWDDFAGFRGPTSAGYVWPAYRKSVADAKVCDFEGYESLCDSNTFLFPCKSGGGFRPAKAGFQDRGNDAIAYQTYAGKKIVIFRGSDDGRDWINNFNAMYVGGWVNQAEPRSVGDWITYAAQKVFNPSAFWIKTAKIVVNFVLRRMFKDPSIGLTLDGTGFSTEYAQVSQNGAGAHYQDLLRDESGSPHTNSQGKFDVCVGHSLGGALAVEAAYNGKCGQVVTFGAPHNPKERQLSGKISSIVQYQMARPVMQRARSEDVGCAAWGRTQECRWHVRRTWWSWSWYRRCNWVSYCRARRIRDFFHFDSYVKDIVPELAIRQGQSLLSELGRTLGGATGFIRNGHRLLGRKERCTGRPFSFVNSVKAMIETHRIELYGAPDEVMYDGQVAKWNGNAYSYRTSTNSAYYQDNTPKRVLCEPNKDAASVPHCFNYGNADMDNSPSQRASYDAWP